MKKVIILIICFIFFTGCVIPPNEDQINEDQVQETTELEEEAKALMPSGIDIINLFWQLINDHQIPEAIEMMSADLITSESVKQAYGVQFNDIKSVNVIDVEPYDSDNWTDDWQVYKVTLEIYVSSDASNQPIPYYGYEDNPNIRFISLKKNEVNKWLVASIATGP